MADADAVAVWTRLSAAVRSKDWPAARTEAVQLKRMCVNVRAARASRGVPDPNLSLERDGIYRIGWQHLLDAPEGVRKVIEDLNAEILQIPGGIGRQLGRRRRSKKRG